MKAHGKIAAAAIAVLMLAGCSSGSGAAGSTTAGSAAGSSSAGGAVKGRAVSWLLSRPADGAVITTVKALADDYAKTHPGFSLNLMTTPDRPSYIQKYETLAAGNKLPDLFDTDATPFAQKLAKQGRMMDVSKLLKDMGVYDNYRPSALNYQRFDDGSLYMVPFEYQLEVFWYNKALFSQAGVSVPTSLDQIPALCHSLRAKGITPIALDGQDQWPLERYVAFQPFRQTATTFVKKLKQAQTSFDDPAGQKTVTWMADLGSNKCFEDGFSSTGYSDAQALFTSGKAAMYNIGTWELSSLATDKLDAKVRNDVNFFTLPTTSNSVTGANEYFSPSGIGMAVNAKTYDPLMADFLKYLLTRYPAKYAALGNLSPTTNAPTTIPANATPLYQKLIDLADHVGPISALPWDTQLDPTSNTRLQQELVTLVQGDTSPSEFTSTMNSTIQQNAPKYFK